MAESKEPKGREQESVDTPEIASIDFATFILSLSTSALYQMGVVPHPESGKVAEEDFLLAQQTIDTLEMLEEKTRGNLDPEEKKLMEGLLYELRMHFVEKAK